MCGQELGGRPIPFNSYVQGKLHVYMEYSAPWTGEVYQWNIFANRSGEFYAGFWRKSGGKYKLIGKNHIVVAEAGYQVRMFNDIFNLTLLLLL